MGRRRSRARRPGRAGSTAQIAPSFRIGAPRADPTPRPLIDRYLRGAGDVSAEDRVRIFRLAWDFAGRALGNRGDQYE